MKKILILVIIISLTLNNVLITFSFAQDEEKPTFSHFKASCSLKKIEIEDIEESTSSVDYISELEGFTGAFGEGEGGTNILKGILTGILADIAIGAIQDLLSGLLGKVPVGASETNNAIATSIRESTKNILASIRTSIQLAIQDALQYLKFQLINKLNELIYKKILKNFIKDIEVYRNFRSFIAYQRAYNRAFNKFKNLDCLPEEIKGCLDYLIKNANKAAEDIVRQAENSDKLIKFVRGFYKLQELSIVEKRSCENYELPQVYKTLDLINPTLSVSEETEEEIYALLKRPEKYVAKAETYKPKGGLANFFANIKNFFGAMNLRKLTAQIAPDIFPEDIYKNYDILFDTNQLIRDQINVSNCLMINDRILRPILTELSKTSEQFTAQTQQPGGLTFKPKTQCLKTWTEVEYEETMSALATAMEKGNMEEINRLEQAKINLEKQLEKEKEISGEDPNCLIPGPTLNSPADYEKLKEQILTAPLEIFKSQERATNVLIAFIRSWLASKLFKIIDKGFASLEAKSSSNYYYLSDIKKAYEPGRVEKICAETESTAVPKIKESCQAALGSQFRKIVDIERQSIMDLQKRVGKALLNISLAKQSLENIMDKISSSTDFIQTKYKDYISQESLDQLTFLIENIKSVKEGMESGMTDADNASSSLSEFLKSDVYAEINSTTEKYQQQIDEINKKLQKVQKELEELNRKVNQKLASMFNLSNLYSNKISTFFADYFDLAKPLPRHFPLEFIGYIGAGDISMIGENPSFQSCSPALGIRVKLSFFSDFYPTHIKECLFSKSYSEIESRFNLSTLDIDPFAGEDIKLGEELFDVSIYAIYFIIHDLIYIFYSLYNVPATKTGMQQENLLFATYNYLTNLINGQVEVNKNTEEELNMLYVYFEALEKYASNTIEYAKTKEQIGRKVLDVEFVITKGNKKWNEGLKLRIGESLDLILNIGKEFKEVIDIYRTALKEDPQLLNKLEEQRKLQEELASTTKAMENELNGIWGKYINSIDYKELQNIESILNQTIEKINENIDSVNNYCEEYNNLIDKIEEEINTKMSPKPPEGELPPEESPSESKLPAERFTLTQRIFEVTKGLLANIFSIFNIFKSRKIYIK